jgi:hypothetical protein
MRWLLLLAAVGVVACRSSRTLPEGRADTSVHEEYGEFRPVAIAVLPVHAPSSELRGEVRKELYMQLFDRRYSPFKLDVVDAYIDSNGDWDPGRTLDWDAALDVDITRWKAIGGTDRFAADGTATLRHRTGEVLWTCKFERHAFNVPSRAGVIDQKQAAREIAEFLVGEADGRFPERPPHPRE